MLERPIYSDFRFNYYVRTPYENPFRVSIYLSYPLTAFFFLAQSLHAEERQRNFDFPHTLVKSVGELKFLQYQLEQANLKAQVDLNCSKTTQIHRFKAIEMIQQLLNNLKKIEPQNQHEVSLEIIDLKFNR